jgi:hypothetical protein
MGPIKISKSGTSATIAARNSPSRAMQSIDHIARRGAAQSRRPAGRKCSILVKGRQRFWSQAWSILESDFQIIDPQKI